MGTLSSAWLFYLPVVGGIYLISSKASDIFNSETVNSLALQARTFSLSRYIQGVNANTKRFVDKLFRFRLLGFIFVPSLGRTALLSLLNFLVIGLAADLAVYIAYPGELSPTGYGGRLQGILEQPFFWSVTLTIALVSNFISDLISFTKTRTVLQVVSDQKSVAKILLFYAIDFVLSCLIPILLASVVIITSENILHHIYNVPTSNFFIGFFVYRGANTVAIISFSTSLFIFFCGLIIGFLSYVVLLLHRGELLRNAVVTYLNFESKPNIAIGILAILIFTVIYWPLVICTVVLNALFDLQIDVLLNIFSLVLVLVAIIGQW
jgi:hypothetical protein